MTHIRSITLPSLLFAAACASGSSSPTPPASSPNPGTPSTPVAPPTGGAPIAIGAPQAAVSLGVTIMAANATGAPRLLRSIVPRPAAAGMATPDAARDHVTALAKLWIQKANPIGLADNGTQQLRNGASIVKLTQHVGGIPVHNAELRVMMHPDGSLVAVSGTLLPAGKAPGFVSTSKIAVERALDQLYGKARARPAVTEAGTRAGWTQLTVAADPQLRVISARARQELTPVGNGQYGPRWSVEIVGLGAAAPNTDPSLTQVTSHRYAIDDADGRIVGDADLIQHDAFVYRAYAETTGNRHPLDSPLQDFTPHPTGKDDNQLQSAISSNLVVMEAFNSAGDKWLPDDATTTSGNNVVAISDFDGSLDLSEGDLVPRVRAGRVLNYPYDTTLSPLATTAQANAGAVNVFFTTNWLHDWWYDSGFTESTGNAQADNFGRGGVDGDPLRAFAQNGALTGSRDNAFMSTPGDGASPLMAMFLWSSGTKTALSTPAGLVRSEAFVAAPHVFDLTGDVAIVNDGVAPGNDGCQPIRAGVAGKIALATFSGACGSATIVGNVAAVGAIGVILVDGTLDDPRLFAGNAAAGIPGLAIGATDGAALAAQVAAGTTTVELSSAPTGPERDGDLDNTVVSHEWGHYLHHRLAICDFGAQCGGMSEGWGDFDALLLVARDGDDRNGTYAMGQYAEDDGTFDSAFFGIRRFPYSADLTKNALSFRHIADSAALPDLPGRPNGIANSEVHNVGEVWTSMMWEVFNVLIDQHGFDVAHRRMSDIVVAGLLLAPPEATFTEQRDALLAAASGLDTDDMLLMAGAFAGRGLGSCAVGPDNAALGNEGVVESGTIAAKLEVGTATLTDDGISCDHDGVLDPGESGFIRLTVANAGPLAAEQVTVTPSTSNTGLKFGAPVVLPALQPFSSVDLAIPVTLLATAPRNTTVTINVHIAGEDTCDRAGTTLAITQLTGVDEVAAAAKVDHVETTASPWTPTGTFATAFWGRASIGSNHVLFGQDADFITDTQLVSPALAVSPTDPFIVKIDHAFDLEASGGFLFDGGVIELSSDGGTTWTDVSALGVNPGYTGTIFVGAENPLSGQPAFSGTSPAFPALHPLTLNFGTQFAGRSVRLRFRIGTDEAAAQTGWVIDNIDVSGITNTPFPALVPEPSTCTARKVTEDAGPVVATHAAPSTSLSAFDNVSVTYK